MKTRTLTSCVLGLLLTLAVSADATAQQEIQTPAEVSGFTRYTSFAEMVEYLEAVQAGSLDMRLGTYGESWQGRTLPYAVFSRPAVRDPREAMVSGRPVVLLAANVHGGERTLRESLLIMIRDLAARGTPLNAVLDDLVVLVVPSINPDGFEATERGIRGNAWGIDMNRDYMKLEQPALRDFVGNVVNRWHPHLAVDGHNGGSYPYNICYQGPSNDSSAPAITDLCDREIFPLIDRRMEEQGYRSFYYSGGNEEGWRVGGSDPRIGRNYLGMANTVGILFESPGGQEMEPSVESGVVAYSAVLEFARTRADHLVSLVSEVRRETVAMGTREGEKVTVAMEYAPEEWTVDYQYLSGDRRTPREERELVTVTGGKIVKEPVPTARRDRPWAYLLPRDAVDAARLLLEHGIAVEVLREAVTLEVQAYRLEDLRYRREYNHDAAVIVEVGEVVTVEEEFPEGTYVIPTDQVMGRVAAHLMEPETNDNIFRWNRMDAWLPKPRLERWKAGEADEAPLLPVYKLLRPAALPTTLHR
ncbi:MAG: M14 family zinc carboxypeptidase [bacterium]